MGDTVKHRAAVVAEGRRQEREHIPFVLLAHLGTRKRGPGKPGPSLWSDPVAGDRETAAACQSIYPTGVPGSGKEKH